MKSQYEYNDIHSCFSKDIDDTIFLKVLLLEIRGLSISHSSYKEKEREKIKVSLIRETSLELNLENLWSGSRWIEEWERKKQQNTFKI